MRKATLKCLITFESTAQAMKMDKLAKVKGISGRLIPIPTVVTAGCGLAFCTETELTEICEDLIKNEGIEDTKIYHLLV